MVSLRGRLHAPSRSQYSQENCRGPLGRNTRLVKIIMVADGIVLYATNTYHFQNALYTLRANVREPDLSINRAEKNSEEEMPNPRPSVDTRARRDQVRGQLHVPGHCLHTDLLMFLKTRRRKSQEGNDCVFNLP